jgi:hypothetical protein
MVRVGVAAQRGQEMRIVGFAGPNELRRLRFAEGQLLCCDGAPEQLVDKPQSLVLTTSASQYCATSLIRPARTIASTSPPSIPDDLPGRPTILQISASFTLAPEL